MSSDSRVFSDEERADIIKVGVTVCLPHTLKYRAFCLSLNYVLQDIMAQNEIILEQHRKKIELEVQPMHPHSSSLSRLLSCIMLVRSSKASCEVF